MLFSTIVFPTDLHQLDDLNLVFQGHDLAVDRLHGDDVLVVLVKVDAVDAGEELLEVGLDDGGVGGLPQDLQQVVVADEVEARELSSLFLQTTATVEEY